MTLSSLRSAKCSGLSEGYGCIGCVSGKPPRTCVREVSTHARSKTTQFSYIGVFFHGRVWYTRLNKSGFVMVDNMEWFNVFGLIFIAVSMIPNVVFAIKCKDGFDNKWNNKYVEVTEQVGRLGCFGFMIINIPGTWFGWWSDEAFVLYLIVDTILVMLYCAIWIICFKKNSVFRALALSIIPSMLFLFSGIMSRSVLLIIASVLFAPSHIVISCKNVK